MTTAADVISRLNLLLSDSANAKLTEAQKLEAVNAAIDGAWPHVKRKLADTSITLAANTFEYTPSATPEAEEGFSVAYATGDNEPDLLLRGLRQYQNGITWTVIVPANVALDFAGETLKLLYHGRHARVTATSDTVYLPLDYLAKAAAAWCAQAAMVKGTSFDVEMLEKLAVLWQRDAESALRAMGSGFKPLPAMIPFVVDFGSSSGAGRYGQNIISNP